MAYEEASTLCWCHYLDKDQPKRSLREEEKKNWHRQRGGLVPSLRRMNKTDWNKGARVRDTCRPSKVVRPTSRTQPLWDPWPRCRQKSMTASHSAGLGEMGRDLGTGWRTAEGQKPHLSSSLGRVNACTAEEIVTTGYEPKTPV